MVTEVTKSCEKVALKFVCKNCHYETSKKSSYDKHLLTVKHSVSLAGDIGDATCDIKVAKSCLLICEKCNKSYNSRNGLWKHKKICKNDDSNDINNNTELVKYLMKENSELKNMVLDVCKSIKPIEQNQINCNNTINSNNKSFNLNVFLNETCKDAMNIMEFIDSLKIQLSDLENVGKLGYVQGMTKIIINNLNLLDENKRPVHCTDSKREVLYVKDENKWEKENEEKKQLRKMIKHVTHKNTKLLKEFKIKYPGCENSESKYSVTYDKLFVEAFGGKGDNEYENDNKIIRNIAKHVIIDKSCS
jgi:hypothetical protein